MYFKWSYRFILQWIVEIKYSKLFHENFQNNLYQEIEMSFKKGMKYDPPNILVVKIKYIQMYRYVV